MITEREDNIRKANRFFNEAPEDATSYNTTTVNEEEEGIEIFFGNLDKESQQKIMDSVKASLNISDDDSISSDKINDAFAKQPLILLRGSEVALKYNNFEN